MSSDVGGQGHRKSGQLCFVFVPIGDCPMRPNSQISIDLGSPVNARTSDICFRNKNRSNAFQQIRYKRDYYQPHKIIRHVLIFIEKTRNKKPDSKKWILNRLSYISAALARQWWVGSRPQIGSQPMVRQYLKEIIRIPTVKLKIPGKAFLKSESRISVTFKL